MTYYFLGIGGIGMSALARYFHQRGDKVCGYDRTETPLTRQLQDEGIDVHYQDDPSLQPTDIDLVVYTPAIPDDTAEMVAVREKGLPIKKRSRVLGELTRGKRCIAVAGTHGKTTTSALITHLLVKGGVGCSAFLGGISKNLGSNMLVDVKSDYVVVEADEYDRSFLQLTPYYSVITATDPDHLDIYGTHKNLIDTFAQYANQTEKGGKLFLKEGLLDDYELPVHATYTAHGIEADYYPWNVRTYNGDIYFDLRTPEKVIYDLQLTNAPLYNVENAVAASAVALECGLNEYQLRAGLKSFEGVARRFDYRIKRKDLVFIDDYAHHPEEIKAVIESVRFLYPDKRLVGIFQPHLFSRTADLADGFAEALSALDEIVLLSIYPARERPIPGVSSHLILRKIDKMSKYYVTNAQLFELLPALCPDIVLTLGAGNIDQLVPQIVDVLNDL